MEQCWHASDEDLLPEPRMIDNETGRERSASLPSTTVLSAIARHRVAVAGISLACAMLGYAASLAMPVRYSASARVFLDEGWLQSVAGSMDPARVVRTESGLALSTGSVAAIARRSRLSVSAVGSRLSAQPSSDGDFFTLTAVGPTSRAATELVQAAEASYQAVIADQQQVANTQELATLATARHRLMQQVARVNVEIARTPTDPSLKERRVQLLGAVAALDRKTSDALVSGITTSSPVQLAETPRVPTSPVFPTPKRNAVIAAILGLIVGSAVAWWFEVRSASEARRRRVQLHHPQPASALPGVASSRATGRQ